VVREKKTKDEEYIPLKQDITAYLQKEVEKPYKILEPSVVGYEINFTQYFYKYKPLRETNDIAKEITETEKESQKLMRELGMMK
jgi:type I restriction enzyme M protein